MSASRRRFALPLLLGAFLGWGVLPACNLVVGGEDKVLVGLDATNGGAGGLDGAGAGGSGLATQGGEGGVGGTSGGAGGNGSPNTYKSKA